MTQGLPKDPTTQKRSVSLLSPQTVSSGCLLSGTQCTYLASFQVTRLTGEHRKRERACPCPGRQMSQKGQGTVPRLQTLGCWASCSTPWPAGGRLRPPTALPTGLQGCEGCCEAHVTALVSKAAASSAVGASGTRQGKVLGGTGAHRGLRAGGSLLWSSLAAGREGQRTRGLPDPNAPLR